MTRFLVPLALIVAPVCAQSITLEKVAEGFGLPTDLVSPPGDARLFVAQNDGRIFVIENGDVVALPFLDLKGVVHQNEGLAGLAFHPDHANNGYLYVAYLDLNLDAQLVRYTVTADPNVADPASAVPILDPFAQPTSIHNWCSPRFGPDGMLYLPTGDGVQPGNQTDNFAQDVGSLLGKVLRLDVDAPYPHIPPDNPFVGLPGFREEVWALGLRNPWRASFDPVTGELWIGDVGRATWEEVNAVPAGAGSAWNFGWRCLEGNECQGFAGCDACDGDTFVAPIHVYRHGDGRCALIGGHVYRGAAVPGLQGRYFFGDHCTGRAWSLLWDGALVTDIREETASFVAADGSRPEEISAFGQDAAGEVYVLDSSDGEVFRIAVGCGDLSTFCIGNPNSTGGGGLAGASGSLVVADDALVLSAHRLPPSQPGYFLFSDSTTFIPFFGGSQGNLCLAPPQVRFVQDVLDTGPGGELTFDPDLADLPQGVVFQPGETWYFQLWYRDANPTATSNTTNGVAVTFCG